MYSAVYCEEVLIEDAKFIKYQYEHILMQAVRRNANIYPLYQNFSAAQKECYPKLIEITEKGTSVDLQSLIEHTIKRLIKSFNVSLPPIANRVCELELILKWGCDGSDPIRVNTNRSSKILKQLTKQFFQYLCHSV